MANTPLDSDAILALLKKPAKEGKATKEGVGISPYPLAPHNGPLQRFEERGYCATKHCTVSTFFKVSGIYRCWLHCLEELNRLLVKAGIESSVCDGCGIRWYNSYNAKSGQDDLEFDEDKKAYVCKHCKHVIASGPREYKLA